MPLSSLTSESEFVRIPIGSIELRADLWLPEEARALIFFPNASAGGRKSGQNQLVAKHLRSRRLGSLLLDLVTAEEERVDAVSTHLRFAIPLLAKRLRVATEWMSEHRPTKRLPFGYLGASTGAAAALTAAAERPHGVFAVVSRGGAARSRL